MKKEGREKIGYPFVPFPKALCTTDYFRSPQLLIFFLWIFSRFSFVQHSRLINGQLISLDAGEFIFGRRICSEETGLSEQVIRTYLKNLIGSQTLQKVTNKSTNKFTVYKLLYERFYDFSNHQTNQQSTSGQPATNHNQDKEIKESKQQHKESASTTPTHVLPAAAALPVLQGKARKLFDILNLQERDAIVALYHQRIRIQPIKNPEAWVSKCINEGWHLEEKLMLPEPTIEPSDYENNKAFAEKLIQQLESTPNLHICLRRDFLELGLIDGQRWQIFFSDIPKKFLSQVKEALRRLEERSIKNN
jgi:hypothetical protein